MIFIIILIIIEVENIKTFFWNVKEKAQNYVEKAKENWK